MPPKRASRSAAAAEAEQPAVSPSSPAAAALPLAQRTVDIWIAVWFVLFAFSTTFTDLHNFTASVLGVEVSELKALAAAVRSPLNYEAGISPQLLCSDRPPPFALARALLPAGQAAVAAARANGAVLSVGRDGGPAAVPEPRVVVRHARRRRRRRLCAR